MARLYSYSKLPTLARMLRERHDILTKEAGGSAVFMLPSLANEDFLLDAIAKDGGYFGERPEIWSWAALYRAVVPPLLLRRQVDPPDHRLILKFVLKSALGDLDERGVAVPKGVRRSGFIDVLSSSIRELLLEDIPPDRLLAGIVPDEKTIEPRELLYRLYTDYLLYLERNGLADNAQLPILTRRACAEDCGRLRGRSMLWVGFLSFTGAQIKLIRLLERYGVRMEFFSPDAGLENFYDAPRQLGLERKDAGDCGGRIVTLLARDAYGQFDRIAREIALSRAGVGELYEAAGVRHSPDMLDDIGILADSADLPLMASALAKYGIASESRAERPVSETLLVRAARLAWDAYVRDWPMRKTLHLLSSPVWGLDLDAERVALRTPEGWRAWREVASDTPGAGEVLDRLKKFCEFLADSAGHTGEELLQALLELAGDDEWEMRLSAEVGDDLALDSSVREVASSRLEVRQKLELLSELQPAIGEAGEVRFSGSDAMAFIVNWSREATTALPQPQRGAVRLYDSPPPVMASHRLWVMTDVTPARYPGGASDASLLGAEVRESVNDAEIEVGEGDVPAHLPTLHEKREQKEALFRRLLATGDDVTILARPANDSQGRPQGDSPFLTALLSDPVSGWTCCGEIVCDEDATLPSGNEVLFGEDEITEGSGQVYRGRFPRTGLLQKNIAGEKPRVRLSALDTWIDCPFLYWCGLMGLEPPRDVSSAVDAPQRGNLLHELWQRVWEKWDPEGKEPLAVFAMAEWEKLWEEKRNARSPLADPKASAVIANLTRMVRNVARKMDEIEEAAQASGLQRDGVLLECELPDYEGRNAVFAGRADRVDLWRDAGAVLIDYKLGKSDRHKDSLQLAAYAYLLEAAGAFPIEGFGFIGHRDARVRGNWSDTMIPVYKGGKRSPRDSGPETAVAEAERVVSALDESTGAGRFEANYDSQRCKACPYGIVCRRAERRGAVEEGGDDESGE